MRLPGPDGLAGPVPRAARCSATVVRACRFTCRSRRFSRISVPHMIRSGNTDGLPKLTETDWVAFSACRQVRIRPASRILVLICLRIRQSAVSWFAFCLRIRQCICRMTSPDTAGCTYSEKGLYRYGPVSVATALSKTTFLFINVSYFNPYVYLV